MRSRFRCRARGCRPLRFFVCSRSGLSSLLLVRAAADSSSSGSLPSRAPRTMPVALSRTARFCALRCASSSSRSRLRNLSSSRTLELQLPAQIHHDLPQRLVASFGRVFGSIAGTMCFQLTRKPSRFQAKTNYLGMFLRRARRITFAPLRLLQIDAAQQRAEFFRRDLGRRSAPLRRKESRNVPSSSRLPTPRIRRGVE